MNAGSQGAPGYARAVPLGSIMNHLGVRFSVLTDVPVEAEWTTGEDLHQICPTARAQERIL